MKCVAYVTSVLVTYMKTPTSADLLAEIAQIQLMEHPLSSYCFKDRGTQPTPYFKLQYWEQGKNPCQGRVGGLRPLQRRDLCLPGGGRGLDRAKFQQLEHWVHGHLQPDLTLLFDLPLDVARERIVLASRVLDRFEQERADFHERVRQAYLERAHSSPARFRVIDAQQSIDSIRTLLENVVSTICL